jgi:transcription elongation factor GreA
MTLQHQSHTITAGGYRQLSDELQHLSSVGRRRIADLIRDAREDGDLNDNPGLLDLLTQQASLEARIAHLSEQLAGMQIARTARDGTIDIGSFVTVLDITTGEVDEYELVAEIEADASVGKLSVEAPIGSALYGLRVGAIARIATPSGALQLEVLRCTSEQ